MLAKTSTAKIEYVPLNRLRFGHEAPHGSINSRTTDREADIDQMKASILAEGILQSVLACNLTGNDEQLYLGIGNRRLAALHALKKEKKKDKDGVPFDDSYPVPAIIWPGTTPAEARRASLAENIGRVPLHPVDRFEAFSKEKKDGLTIEQIATRHGLAKKIVEQSLALGALAPEIRAAWRKGKIDQKMAQAFTVEPDQKRQASVLDRVVRGQSWNQTPHRVRDELIGSQHEAIILLKYVGKAAYEKEGGTLMTDLFSERDEDPIINHPALLKKLAETKLDRHCLQLVAEGWKWAEHDDNARRWQFNRLDPAIKKTKFSDEQKKKSGCFLIFNGNGQIIVEGGYVKSRERAAVEKATATRVESEKEKKKGPAQLPNSLKVKMKTQLDTATKKALAAIAGKDLCGVLCGVCSNSIEPGHWHGYTISALEKNMSAIRDVIPAKVINEAIHKAFDAEGYFKSAPKPFVLKAIGEAVHPDQAKQLANGKKSEMVKVAVANCGKSKWLPPEMRTAHYDGPKPKAKRG